MELQQRLDCLINLAQEMGMEIRRESLGGNGGGRCMLKGKAVLFVDTTADLETNYETIVAALARLPEIEQRFLSPLIREDMERARSGQRP
jgi:hypothetical protein